MANLSPGFLTVAPPPTSSANDDFNRADAAALGTSSGGGTWTDTGAAGGCRILSNKAMVDNVGGLKQSVIETGLANSTITVDWVASVSNKEQWVTFRYSDESNFWFVYALNNAGIDITWKLYKKVAAADTEVNAAGGYARNTLYALTIITVGSSITVKLGGTTVMTATDSALASNTKIGLGGSCDVAGENMDTWDNLVVTS